MYLNAQSSYMMTSYCRRSYLTSWYPIQHQMKNLSRRPQDLMCLSCSSFLRGGVCAQWHQVEDPFVLYPPTNRRIVRHKSTGTLKHEGYHTLTFWTACFMFTRGFESVIPLPNSSIRDYRVDVVIHKEWKTFQKTENKMVLTLSPSSSSETRASSFVNSFTFELATPYFCFSSDSWSWILLYWSIYPVVLLGHSPSFFFETRIILTCVSNCVWIYLSRLEIFSSVFSTSACNFASMFRVSSMVLWIAAPWWFICSRWIRQSLLSLGSWIRNMGVTRSTSRCHVCGSMVGFMGVGFAVGEDLYKIEDG